MSLANGYYGLSPQNTYAQNMSVPQVPVAQQTAPAAAPIIVQMPAEKTATTNVNPGVLVIQIDSQSILMAAFFVILILFIYSSIRKKKVKYVVAPTSGAQTVHVEPQKLGTESGVSS